jgi:hypothetical protein
MEMGFARRDRGCNSLDPRINPIHRLRLSLRQLQQDLRFVGRSASSADLDVAVGVCGAVRSRDQRRGRTADTAGYNGWSPVADRQRKYGGRGYGDPGAASTNEYLVRHIARYGSMSVFACYQTEECDQSVVILRHSPHDRVLILLRRPVPRVIAQQIVALG